MDAWEYIVNSLAWSAGGLFIGYLLGRADRALEEPIIEEDPRDKP
jgi:hypothetical protein